MNPKKIQHGLICGSFILKLTKWVVKTYQQKQQQRAFAAARHGCGVPHSSAEPTVKAICPDYLTDVKKPSTSLLYVNNAH